MRYMKKVHIYTLNYGCTVCRDLVNYVHVQNFPIVLFNGDMTITPVSLNRRLNHILRGSVLLDTLQDEKGYTNRRVKDTAWTQD